MAPGDMADLNDEFDAITPDKFRTFGVDFEFSATISDIRDPTEECNRVDEELMDFDDDAVEINEM